MKEAAFLKKRSKKLLSVGAHRRLLGATPSSQSFFASFCSQKEDSS